MKSNAIYFLLQKKWQNKFYRLGFSCSLLLDSIDTWAYISIRHAFNEPCFLQDSQFQPSQYIININHRMQNTSNNPNSSNSNNNPSLQQPRNSSAITKNIFSRNVIENPLTNPSRNTSSSNITNIFTNKPITINQTSNNVENSLVNAVSFPQKNLLAENNPFNKLNSQTNNSVVPNVFNSQSRNNAFANINTTKPNITSNQNNQNSQNANNNISNNFGAIFQKSSQNQMQLTNIQKANNGILCQNQQPPNQSYSNANFKEGGNNKIFNGQGNNISVSENREIKAANNTASTHQAQLIDLFKSVKMDEPEFNKVISPFNFYHTKLMLSSLINNIKANIDPPQESKGKQLKQKVKDSKYKTEILILIKQMNTTAQQLKNIRNNAKSLQNRTDRIKSQFRQSLLARKDDTFSKFRWQKMGQSIIEELNNIQDYLSDVIRPIFKAYQENKGLTCQEPDSFSLSVASILQKKIEKIQISFEQLIGQAKEYYNQLSHLNHQNSQQGDKIIQQLSIYFEDLCIKFEQLRQFFDGRLQKQTKKTISLIENRTASIQQQQTCRVKYFIDAFSRIQNFKIQIKSNSLHDTLRKQ